MTVALATASPVAATPTNYSLGQWGQLGLDLPAGWTARAQKNDAVVGSAVQITPGGDAQLVLLMTPVPAAGRAEELEAAARKGAETARPGLPVWEVQSEEGHAYYTSATDETVEKPSATSFKFVDQGVAAVGRLMVSFTIQTNVRDGGVREQALEIVRTARHLPPGPPWRTAAGGVAMSYPGKAWKLALALPGFEIDPFQVRPGGKGVKLTARNAATGMIVSALLEEAHPGWTAVERREDAWKSMQADTSMDREDVKRAERGPLAILELRVPTYWGREVNQQNVNAYLVRDGVSVNVHLSKVNFKESDRALFEKVLESVRVVE